MKKIFALLVSVAFILTATYFVIAAADGGYDGLYVVFGDSIAAGYGLDGSETGSAESMRYVAGRDSDAYAGIVSRALNYDLNNFAVSGDTTADMLGVLNKSGVLGSVAKADLVTVSIGGNDMIGMASTILPRAAMYEAMGDLISISRTDESIEQMYATLESNLTSIMQTLVRANNGKGKIYLQTLYNPFKYNTSYRIDFGSYYYNVGNLIDYYINRINEIYARVCVNVGGFELVDTATALNADGRCFYEISTPDFHPTAYGHGMIAQTILAKYEKPVSTAEATASSVYSTIYEPTASTTYITAGPTSHEETAATTTVEPSASVSAETATTATVETTASTTSSATATAKTTAATSKETTATTVIHSTAAETTVSPTVLTENTQPVSTVSPTTSSTVPSSVSTAEATTAPAKTESGCGSAITGGAILAVSASLLCIVNFKKKERK